MNKIKKHIYLYIISTLHGFAFAIAIINLLWTPIFHAGIEGVRMAIYSGAISGIVVILSNYIVQYKDIEK